MLKLMLCCIHVFGRGHKQAGCKAVSDGSMNIWLTCFKLLFIKVLVLINVTMADDSLLTFFSSVYHAFSLKRLGGNSSPQLSVRHRLESAGTTVCFDRMAACQTV